MRRCREGRLPLQAALDRAVRLATGDQSHRPPERRAGVRDHPSGCDGARATRCALHLAHAWASRVHGACSVARVTAVAPLRVALLALGAVHHGRTLDGFVLGRPKARGSRLRAARTFARATSAEHEGTGAPWDNSCDGPAGVAPCSSKPKLASAPAGCAVAGLDGATSPES